MSQHSVPHLRTRAHLPQILEGCHERGRTEAPVLMGNLRKLAPMSVGKLVRHSSTSKALQKIQFPPHLTSTQRLLSLCFKFPRDGSRRRGHAALCVGRVFHRRTARHGNRRSTRPDEQNTRKVHENAVYSQSLQVSLTSFDWIRKSAKQVLNEAKDNTTRCSPSPPCKPFFSCTAPQFSGSARPNPAGR